MKTIKILTEFESTKLRRIVKVGEIIDANIYDSETLKRANIQYELSDIEATIKNDESNDLESLIKENTELKNTVEQLEKTNSDLEDIIKNLKKELDKDDLEDNSEEDELYAKELLEEYKQDKSIVDDLKADDLKILCEVLGVAYTNVKDSKEALKILTIG